MEADPRVPIRCEYNPGYGSTIEIYITEIIPSMFVTEHYLLLKTETEDYPATWIDWTRGKLEAGCYENF